MEIQNTGPATDIFQQAFQIVPQRELVNFPRMTVEMPYAAMLENTIKQ